MLNFLKFNLIFFFLKKYKKNSQSYLYLYKDFFCKNLFKIINPIFLNYFLIKYIYKKNLKFIYLFKYNLMPSYSFSQNFKIKKYKNAGLLQLKEKELYFITLKYLFFIYLYVFNNNNSKKIFFFFEKIVFSFYASLNVFCFFFFKYKNIFKNIYINISGNYFSKYLKKKASLKKKRNKVLIRKNKNNLFLINLKI